MADSRDLLVRILGDDRSLQAAFTRTERRTRQFESRTTKLGSGLTRAFAAAGITLGTAAVFKGISDSIAAASALNEEISKSEQVFGSSSVAIQAWSKNTADSIGVAQTEALKATGTFGNLFATVGLGQSAAAGMSRELVELAADLASFNNADPSEVLNAIRSGLIGEAEPLRRFGVLLSEARVQQEAMAASGKKSAKELTNQEKALARYNIILNDTQLAQGDFARTQDTLANQSRILRAQLSDLSAEMGTKLLPSLVKIVGATNDLIDAFTQAGDTLDPKLGETLADVDVSGIIAMRDRLAEVKGEGDAVVGILDEIIRRLNSIQQSGTINTGPGGRGPAGNALIAEGLRQDTAKQAKGESARAAKAFNEFVKGMGLKLDKAGLTKSLDDDIAVLRELERAIIRRIKIEGKTFELERLLTDTRLQIAANMEQSTAAVVKVTKATTKNVEAVDKLTAAEKQKNKQDAQLAALEAPVPGVGALKKRLGNLRKQVEGTTLDTKATDAQLDRIAQVLKGRFGKVGREVREAILAMFNDIASGFETGDKTVSKSTGGEITKGGIRSTQRLLRGLDLTEEERRLIQQRNLGVAGRRGFSAFGVGIGGSGRTTGSIDRAGTGAFVIQHLTVVSNDPNDMMKKLQKKARRSSGGRRGRHGGANLGMQ